MSNKLNNKKAYWSGIYLSEFTSTKSLNKLETIVAEGKQPRIGIVASSYIYYNKLDKLSPVKHPNLYRLVQFFIEDKDLNNPLNDYSKLEMYIEEKLCNRKVIDNKRKETLSKYINDELKRLGVSIHLLSKKANVSYSNLYNALKKEEFKNISIDRLKEVREVITKWKNL